MDEKNNFSNRDNYKNGYGKDKKPNWKEIAKREKEWANKTSDEMAVKVGNNMSDYLDYLDIQSRFEMYSASNCLLILNQDKNATYLREYKKWKEDGYEVTDSNKKVIIVKPETVKKEDGSTSIFYKAKRVYDVTNTNAPKLEPKELPDKEAILLAIFNSFKWKVEPVDTLDSGALARYNQETDTLYVCRGGDVDSKIQDVIQETAKRFLKIEIDDPDIELKSFKATSISYLFCKKYGIDFPKERFSEKQNQLSGESKDIKTELESIKDIYVSIQDKMYEKLEPERSNKSKDLAR